MVFANRLRISLVVGMGVLLLAGNLAAAQRSGAKEKPPRDEAEAMKWAEESLVKSGYRVNKIDPQYLLFGDAKGNYGIALARVTSTSAEYGGGYTWRVFWQDYAHEQREAIVLYPRQIDRFKSALDFLAANAQQEAADRMANDFAQFQPQAKAWREAAVKPVMPEEGREHQVLAEFAFKEKNVEKAIAEYNSALAVFPTWPEGQYNLATLAGEKKFYSLAVLHMKEYLELTPDSPDAQAARDSIIIWRDQLQTALAHSGGNNTQASARPRLFQATQAHQK